MLETSNISKKEVKKLQYAAIDFESAPAANEKGQVAIQVGIAVADGQATGLSKIWSSYLDAKFKCGPFFVASVTRRRSEGLPKLIELWGEVRQLLDGRVLLAHGAGTERRFLQAFPGHGFGPWIDTLRLARAAFPEAKSHSLSNLCDFLGISEKLRSLGIAGNKWHDAQFDAAACLFLFLEICQRAHLSPIDPSTLPILKSPTLSRYFQVRKKQKPQ
ncbi:MAG: hypothetical protein N2035_05485 [Chthoniobacterales bacterium]|nr:hypothetical protein [Chthoniobacterales bacterium]